MYDCLIIGGGLAGLSLARQLSKPEFQHLNTLILEPRKRYTRDRTWCHWQIQPHQFDSAASHCWHKLSIIEDEQTCHELELKYPYVRLPADQVYQHALTAIEHADHLDLKLGKRVNGISSDGGHIQIATDDQTYHTKQVFDSRPPGYKPTAIKQYFLGYEIESPGACFEPDKVILMDFRIPQSGVVSFMYVLPLSATSALVEHTVFGRKKPDIAHQDACLRNYLKTYFQITRFKEHYREYGIIPMDPDISPASEYPGIIPLGTRAGAVRPATGYGFTGIQRQVVTLAQQLQQSNLSTTSKVQAPVALSRLTLKMDRIFLRALQHSPTQAIALFSELFKRCEPGALVRFLDGSGSLSDHLQVVKSLPVRPLLRAAVGSKNR